MKKNILLLFVLVVCAWENAAALDNLDTVWLKKYTRDIVKMKYSPDDKYLLTTNLVQGDVIAMPSGEPLQYFGGVSAMEWSKDGKWFVAWVVTGAGNKLVRYETGTWQAIDTIYLPTGDDVNHAMSLASDNRTLAVSWSGNATKKLQFYDLIERKLVKETVVKFEAMNSIYTPDSRYIISHGTDWQIRFFDIAADSVIYTYQFGSGAGLLAISEDGKKIAFTTHKTGYNVEIMDVESRQITSEILGESDKITGISFSEDSEFLAMSSRYLGRLYVYKISSAERIREWGIGSVLDVAYSHSNRYISTNVGKTLILFNAPMPVSVIENNDGKEPELYPNPVVESVTLGLELAVPGMVDLSIASVEGAVMMKQKLDGTISGHNRWNITVKGLSSGAYLAVLQAGRQHKVIRFIKL